VQASSLPITQTNQVRTVWSDIPYVRSFSRRTSPLDLDRARFPVIALPPIGLSHQYPRAVPLTSLRMAHPSFSKVARRVELHPFLQVFLCSGVTTLHSSFLPCLSPNQLFRTSIHTLFPLCFPFPLRAFDFWMFGACPLPPWVILPPKTFERLADTIDDDPFLTEFV